MKREIKFKSYWKHEETGEIGTGFHEIRIDGRSFSAPSQQSNYRDLVGFCQFTGLKDRNGENIYEGDIIEVTNKGSYNGLRVVVWDETFLCYVLIWPDHYKEYQAIGTITGSFLKVSSGLSCYLIGNIHQHPHLLTGDRADTGEK